MVFYLASDTGPSRRLGAVHVRLRLVISFLHITACYFGNCETTQESTRRRAGHETHKCTAATCVLYTLPSLSPIPPNSARNIAAPRRVHPGTHPHENRTSVRTATVGKSGQRLLRAQRHRTAPAHVRTVSRRPISPRAPARSVIRADVLACGKPGPPVNFLSAIGPNASCRTPSFCSFYRLTPFHNHVSADAEVPRRDDSRSGASRPVAVEMERPPASRNPLTAGGRDVAADRGFP